MAENFILRVTAGDSYDLKSHQLVPVNSATPITIDNDLCKIELCVRVQNYTGLPKTAPKTSPYFESPSHQKNKDTYSIGFRFTPKQTVNGEDLVFGNDFDHPIRERLPPLFNAIFGVVKRFIDPGLDGDVYADQPYLYGPAASSLNALYVEKGHSTSPNLGDNGEGLVVPEGGDTEGLKFREEKNIPDLVATRQKFFLNKANLQEWNWEAGTSYGCDFFNNFLDFNEFKLILPSFLGFGGYTVPIMKYWDGQGLRYTLKNLKTGKVLFVVLFTLYMKDDIDEDGNVKAGVEGGMPFDLMDSHKAELHRKKAIGEEGEDEDEPEQTPSAAKESPKVNGDFEDEGVD